MVQYFSNAFYPLGNWEYILKIKFYPLHYKLNKKNRYMIFQMGTDSEDLYYVNEKTKKIPIFSKLKYLKQYAKKHNIKIVNNFKPIPHDLDIVFKWVNTHKKNLECNEVLTAWNFFIDLANTFSFDNDNLQAYKEKAPKAYKIYEKIFIGTNLPSVTKNNPPYHPKFNKKELKLIRNVLTYGFKKFKKNRIKIK